MPQHSTGNWNDPSLCATMSAHRHRSRSQDWPLQSSSTNPNLIGAPMMPGAVDPRRLFLDQAEAKMPDKKEGGSTGSGSPAKEPFRPIGVRKARELAMMARQKLAEQERSSVAQGSQQSATALGKAATSAEASQHFKPLAIRTSRRPGVTPPQDTIERSAVAQSAPAPLAILGGAPVDDPGVVSAQLKVQDAECRALARQEEGEGVFVVEKSPSPSALVGDDLFEDIYLDDARGRHRSAEPSMSEDGWVQVEWAVSE
ncbi:hypothetical protein B0T26DRAFT_365655 [Lasiosphaeria miniovina]|uniref:Uncharacterized protein n=1 Tax=Lasiosphaeria miniovina TaxID=1954250 RepID=A0AA40ACU2_9PEZI|nr:uncharacterized protein B0T26DRAFT_365655 [Lasiosphaeria miniovina]KAK0713490.1 hypothetical protein B0T26DRAFT_365655 [Lasiosphaeria miniovina]